MTPTSTFTGARLPDLATTLQQPAAADGVIRLRKLGPEFEGAILNIADAELSGLEPDLAIVDRPAETVAWQPLPRALHDTVVAWDRAATTAGLNVVACDTVIVARRCWRPPALTLPTTAIAELAAETRQVVEQHGRCPAWAHMPWRVQATVGSLDARPLELPRAPQEKALFDALAAILRRHFEPWCAWFAAIGRYSILQLHEAGGRQAAAPAVPPATMRAG